MQTEAKNCERELEAIHERPGRLLERDEPRQRSLADLEGLLIPEGSVPVSVQESRRLPCRLLWRGVHSIEYVFAWSAWPRRHQYRAPQRHYRRRGFVPPAL